MNTLNELLPEMDFDFFAAGEHAMSIEGMKKVIHNDRFLFLDVRFAKEAEYVVLPFAAHIPFDELPARLDELPRDKCIVTFCSSVFRGACAFLYLQSMGFEEVRGMVAPLEDMAAAFKPGPLASM